MCFRKVRKKYFLHICQFFNVSTAKTVFWDLLRKKDHPPGECGSVVGQAMTNAEQGENTNFENSESEYCLKKLKEINHFLAVLI